MPATAAIFQTRRLVKVTIHGAALLMGQFLVLFPHDFAEHIANCPETLSNLDAVFRRVFLRK